MCWLLADGQWLQGMTNELCVSPANWQLNWKPTRKPSTHIMYDILQKQNEKKAHRHRTSWFHSKSIAWIVLRPLWFDTFDYDYPGGIKWMNTSPKMSKQIYQPWKSSLVCIKANVGERAREKKTAHTHSTSNARSDSVIADQWLHTNLQPLFFYKYILLFQMVVCLTLERCVLFWIVQEWNCPKYHDAKWRVDVALISHSFGWHPKPYFIQAKHFVYRFIISRRGYTHTHRHTENYVNLLSTFRSDKRLRTLRKWCVIHLRARLFSQACVWFFSFSLVCCLSILFHNLWAVFSNQQIWIATVIAEQYWVTRTTTHQTMVTMKSKAKCEWTLAHTHSHYLSLFAYVCLSFELCPFK